MQELSALLAIAAALAVGAASPGPSFIMVARTAVSVSRSDGLAAAMGMGIGGLVFAGLSLFGLQSAMAAVPSLYWALKLLGGLYLAYLGFRIFRGATSPLVVEGAIVLPRGRSLWRSFGLGLGTQVSNPKAAIIYASLFAAFLPAAASPTFNVLLLLLVFGIESGWYVLVALVLSAQAPRATYLRCKAWVDRVAGGVMLALGIRLAATAQS